MIDEMKDEKEDEFYSVCKKGKASNFTVIVSFNNGGHRKPRDESKDAKTEGKLSGKMRRILNNRITDDNEITGLAYDYSHLHGAKTIYISYDMEYEDGTKEHVVHDARLPKGSWSAGTVNIQQKEKSKR